MKYGPQAIEEMCSHVMSGLSNRDAALLIGINEDTFYEWIKKPEVSEKLKRAQAKFKEEHLKIIIANSKKMGPNNWQSSGWLLERKFKDEFGQRQEITGANGVPIVNILPGVLSTQQIEGEVINRHSIQALRTPRTATKGVPPLSR